MYPLSLCDDRSVFAPAKGHPIHSAGALSQNYWFCPEKTVLLLGGCLIPLNQTIADAEKSALFWAARQGAGACS